MAEEKDVKEVVEEKNDGTTKKEKKSFFSRIWNGLIRLHGDDFEKRLRYISKEEATLLARMKKRSTRWRKTARNLIVSSVFLEVVAIGYAIMTTRSVKLEWENRALRVLPIFLLPGLSWALYSGLKSFTGMCDRREQRTLERLRAERQEKINELKERTNYYNTQQLIQRYDPDPAAKAAAASALASKLGADSGLHVFVGDEPHLNQHGIGKSSDVEFMQSNGLRRRNASPGSTVAQHSDKEALQFIGDEVPEISLPGELVVQQQSPEAISPHQDGSWIARLAAMLVGEDPTQSYALICGNCHMHNGLARKEDFPLITYYCPHCHSLNKQRNLDENSSGTNSPDMRSLTAHHHALNKPKNSNEKSSDTKTPDLKSLTTHRHALNKPRNSDEKSSDTKTPDLKSLTKHRNKPLNKPKNSEENSSNAKTLDTRSSTTQLNKPRNSEENSSDTNTPDMKSSMTAVANANLIKQSSESMSESVSASCRPVVLATEESKKIVHDDPTSH